MTEPSKEEPKEQPLEPDEYEELDRHQSISPEHHHICRPFCPCCGGGDHRKGYKHTKAASHAKNKAAKKPKYKDHR